MAFGLSTRASLLVAAACAALALPTTVVDAWLAPLVTKGNKLFDSATGAEFRMKGMAYYPRPNGGEFAGVNGYDWTTDDHESVWAPHLKIMKDLGINTIRLYAVNPSKSHDKFMCAASEAGIYILVGMAAPCPGCAVPEYAPPKCYPDELFTRVQLIYNAFAVYDNTLAFSVGNENNMPTGSDKTGMVTAPCVKALLRDTKAYAAGCASSLRHVPIGLDQADLLPRQQWISYYDCIVDDDVNTSADWLGFNPYVECDPLRTTSYAQAMGLQKLMSEYKLANYTQPLMFGEFGCNKGKNTIDGFENQRAFNDAKWMNEEKQMTDEVVGGNVFEFTTEVANLANGKKLSGASDPGKYGVGFFLPENCDHDTIPCVFTPYPEYENLKKAYTTTATSSATLSTYTPSRDRVLSCPGKISTELPKTPAVETLLCASSQPVCGAAKSNAGKKTRVVDRRVGADGKPLKVVEDDVVVAPDSGSGSGPRDVVTAKPTTKPNGAVTSPSSPDAPAPASSSSALAATSAALTSVAVAVLAVSTVV